MMRLSCLCGLVLALVVAPGVALGQCTGDINGDGDIDLADLAILLAAYDTCTGDPLYNPDADLDDSGCVDLVDLATLLAVYGTSCPDAFITAELAGNSLGEYPYFEYVRAFNEDATVEVAIDPTRFPDVVGQTGDIYIVQAKTAAQWDASPLLTDVTAGGAQTETFGGTTIQNNTFQVTGPFELDADAGLGLGVGYDVVLDMDRNGQLSAGDVIDGYGDEAGLYAVHDTTASGPLGVTEIVYTGGTWLGQDTHYPTSIGGMGQLPLVVISHGNGHNYRWYNHIQNHLGSYGYIVMAHQNDTRPGIESASLTTLTNTDYIIGAQATIAGGVLNGHIDSHRIMWIGHSRGAEGIARAYDRLWDGAYTPTNYTIDDLVLLSSMLPTDFLARQGANPHRANYHLWTASGDADVFGGASNDIAQTFHLHDRATRYRHSTVVQGCGHAWFHDGGGPCVCTGPCLIGETNTHLVQLGLFLPLAKHYIEGNIPAMDFFWRQYEAFRPIGVPTDTFCAVTGGEAIVVNNTYRNGAETGNFVIDNYQQETSSAISSSGGAVTFNVTNLFEGRLDDNNTDFTWVTSDPMNGMTYGRVSDATKGVVFDWNGSDRFYEFEIIAAERDFSDDKYLTFRSCQGTRHPLTIADMGDLTYSVTLRDGTGTTSTINIGAFGGGLEEPYQRTGEGSGVGWANEFETIRIRLTDYLNNDSGLDLTDIVAVRLEFGPSFGSSRGRIGLDDVQLTSDQMP